MLTFEILHISAMTLTPTNKDIPLKKQVPEFGSMLFTRGVSGTRYVSLETFLDGIGTYHSLGVFFF